MWSVEFSQQHDVLATKTLCCWENSTDPITGASFLYILIVSHTWLILLGPDFLCHFNGALHFALQVLHEIVLCHLAISVSSMATISRSNTSIPLMSQITRTELSMSIQQWTLYGVKYTAWEIMTHRLPTSIIIQTYMLVTCSNIMTVSKLIRFKILWYSTSTLLNVMEALLLEIPAEWWNNCQRYSHTLPWCTCIARIGIPLEWHHKSGPSDIIHLLYSGTSKAYSAHWLDCNSNMPVHVPTQYF